MEPIRTAIEQAAGYLAENPEAGRGPDAPATARGAGGLRVRVEGRDGEVGTDMPKILGGGATAPTPGWLMRAALAACEATVVAMEAARDGIELTDLEVTVESESDFRGALGVGESIHAGPFGVQIRIRVAADGASEDQLRAIVERAESRSAVRDALARPITVATEIEVE